MIITGSQALVRCLGNVRNPVDIDMFATQQDAEYFVRHALRQGIEKVDDSREDQGKLVIFGTNGAIIEVDTLDNLTNHALHDVMKRDSKDGLHAPLDWLYFLKMSHRYKKDSPHFMKTMVDIHLMRAAGAQLPKDSEELMLMREKDTYTNNLPVLAVGKDDFFKKTEEFYQYDHDDIHRAVAVRDVPAYTLYMQDGAQVMTNREKFFAQSEETRLLGVLEESYVLALERSLIPHSFIPDPRQAFNMALSKVCTSITGGWFREYSWENYFKVQQMYSLEFVGKFKTALKDGKIAAFQR